MFYEEQLTRRWEAHPGGWDEYPRFSATSCKLLQKFTVSGTKTVKIKALTFNLGDYKEIIPAVFRTRSLVMNLPYRSTELAARNIGRNVVWQCTVWLQHIIYLFCKRWLEHLKQLTNLKGRYSENFYVYCVNYFHMLLKTKSLRDKKFDSNNKHSTSK